MTQPLANSILQALLGLQFDPTGPDGSNRFCLEGLTFGSRDEGALEIRARRFEATSLRLAAGPLVLEASRLELQQLVALVRVDAGSPRLSLLEAASADLLGVKLQGPLTFAPHPHAAAAAAWCLGPLAAANGTLRAEILDAHLMFDADVTVPIRQGQVNFNNATVEHVGPDSRMGVSRLGLYVDAPNGRSYLYQFSSAPVGGVHYEQRGAPLGAWVTDRGNLQLQPFGESLLRQPPGDAALGVTAQARQLLDRTSMAGDVQLGDGRFSAHGMQGDLAGSAEGRNAIRIHSEAVGRGVTADMATLKVRDAALAWRGAQLGCGEITGALTLRLFTEGAQLRFALDLTTLKASGLRLQPPPRAAASHEPR